MKKEEDAALRKQLKVLGWNPPQGWRPLADGVAGPIPGFLISARDAEDMRQKGMTWAPPEGDTK